MPCETDPGLVSRVMGIRSRAGHPVRHNPPFGRRPRRERPEKNRPLRSLRHYGGT